jgi:hypothetical protein
MSERSCELRRVRAAGSPHAIGLALGRAGRAAMQAVILRAEYWRAVTDPRHAPRVAAMEARLAARFPAIRAEIAGLAEGLGLPVEQVLAWNCRGDLLSNVPDGCTTVMRPGPEPLIAHNEDGLPGLRGAAFLAEVAPEGAPGFLAVCYPGSIPGHTCAVTEAGLVQAVNNLRLQARAEGLPRMVLGRAALACESLGAVQALFQGEAAVGGFHMAFACAGAARILSVEYGAGSASVQEITAPALHANHALHLPAGLAAQVITRSSADRQARGTALLAAGAAPLAILRDRGGPGLPIHRSAPDDPDEENTLATALFQVAPGGVTWAVHDQHSERPVHHGHIALAHA